MVTLIGAGPGDSGLLTVKGAKKLREADVVLYDRLVGDDIIAMIPESAEKIDVGKNAGNHPVPQNQINELLLSKALQGLNVARLKGGDPFVFGRGGEELELLAEHNIEFEVVPGVSSAVAGGAYAGIPVTHRDFTSSLHIITGHKRANGRLDLDYASLVKLNGTLVFVMGVSSLNEICAGLLDAGMEREMPAAVIENATMPSQRKCIGNIWTLPDLAKDNDIASPAVIIVGKVCALSDKMEWFMRKPLFGRRVIVTRARTSESVLSDRLRELGCGVIEAPCIRIVPSIDNNAALTEAVNNAARYGWLVFTSAVGVNLFFDWLTDISFDIRCLRDLKIAAIGSETRKAIEKRGVFANYTPERYSGKELAEGLLELVQKDERILLIRARAGSEEITDILAANGIGFDDIAIYDTILESKQSDNVREMLLNRQIDLVTFTSSSTVEGFVKSFPDIDFQSIKGICIGDRTAETARKYGIRTTVSKRATINSMLEKIKEMWGDGYKAETLARQ